MAGTLIRNSDTIAEIFARACDRREMLILVTPEIRFQSSFVKFDGKEFHAAATMGREDATHGLRNNELMMRFPHGISFLEAATELKGFGRLEGRRTLRLSVPDRIEEEDHRGAYRVDRVGRVPLTFSTPRFDLVGGTLVNISTTGARIFSTRDFQVGEMELGEKMAITIQLTEDIRINTNVKLRHVHGRTFGVEFHPQLQDESLTRLSRWIFEKREEDLERIGRRGVETAKAAPSTASATATAIVVEKPEEEAKRPGRTSTRIAIVDDSRLVRTFTAAALKSQGHEVVQIEPTSLSDVLKALFDAPVDLLIVDLLMPDCPGESLITACREDSFLQQLPILVVSAHLDDAVMRRLQRMGISGT